MQMYLKVCLHISCGYSEPPVCTFNCKIMVAMHKKTLLINFLLNWLLPALLFEMHTCIQLKMLNTSHVYNLRC